MKNIRETLKKKVILTDGAMGTYYRRLHPNEDIADAAERANFTNPQHIVEIHKKYIEAGANFIRTNTFAVNHCLKDDAHTIEEYIRQAVKLAREAVGESEVYIAASIGPIHSGNEEEQSEVLQEYKQICDVFLSEGIVVFNFETFSNIATVQKIAHYIKEKSQEAFVMTHFSLNKMGYTKYGYGMQRLVNELSECEEIDSFGFNCGIGAAHMNELLGKIKFPKDCFFAALPNAGYQPEASGRDFFVDNPKYYAKYMSGILEKGVNFIGGCCGTSPHYIAAISDVLEENDRPRKKQIVEQTDGVTQELEKNVFLEKLERGEKVFVVELDSPYTKDADKFIEGAYRLKENKVDMVTISDSPMARPRAEAFEMAIYVENKTGLTMMPHICCRDRNIIGLHAAFLGAHINGIRNLLIITGDPVSIDNRKTITGVFDYNSIKLMDYVKNMNQEFFGNEPFYYGGALNYANGKLEAIAKRMKRKMDAGCSYFLTQPIYSDENIERIRALKEMTGAKIIGGIMPLVSYKNAKFMQNEMPGIHVPDEVVERYNADMTREEAEAVAIDICVEIGKKMQDCVDGYYLMTPFHRVMLVNRIINELREA